MERIKSDRIILNDTIFDGYVYFEDGKIVNVSADEYPVEQTYAADGYYVSPGFIDMHTHGGGGNSFDGDAAEVARGCDFHLKHGTTSICPTISAAELDYMAKAVESIDEAKKKGLTRATILGAHLEGPYLSRSQAGAQCADFITPPKEDEYLPVIERLGDAIARWTYAPENDEGEKFAKTLAENNIVASAGHTDAIRDDMLRAMQSGCNLVTHLYSCTSTITRDHGFRRLGVIETAYLSDDMYVEIICDGKHLPPDLIKLIYKIKGSDRIALVTDSLSLAGSEQTHGFMQATEFIIEDGVCKLMDRSAFAGSIATADRLVRVAVKEADIPLVEAVKMITRIPARIMHLENKGALMAGMDADIVVFDDDINIKQVFARGCEVK